MSMAAALRGQAQSCARLGSPFMARLLTLLAGHWPEDGALAQTCAAWSGDIGPNGASLPLRVASGLHALVLRGNAALAAVYPPQAASDADLIAAVLSALARHEAFLCDWIARPPQTNEVRRSAAIIAAAHWIASRHPLPLITSELGASAGLNLMWDRYALRTGIGTLGPSDAALVLAPDWTGPFPAAAKVTVRDRAGVDLTPLDLSDAEQVLRLLSYLWPDQPERMALTRAALAVQDAPVARGDAVDWLGPRLAAQPEGFVHLLYHTIAWQYFPPERQAAGTALIETAGAAATAERPLAWLAMEHDGNSADTRGAALTLRMWPEDVTQTLARVDFHGRWIEWLAG